MPNVNVMIHARVCNCYDSAHDTDANADCVVTVR